MNFTGLRKEKAATVFLEKSKVGGIQLIYARNILSERVRVWFFLRKIKSIFSEKILVFSKERINAIYRKMQRQ